MAKKTFHVTKMQNVNTLDLLSIDAFVMMDSPEMEKNVNVSTNTDSYPGFKAIPNDIW